MTFGLPGVLAQEVVIPVFKNEPASAGLVSRFEGPEDEYVVGGGVATLDCNADGLPDVYVTGGVNNSRFYRNASAVGGPLTLIEEASGLETANALGAYPLDIDADGQADVVVLRVGEVQVFRGLGGCKFELANDRWNIHTGSHWHTAFSATWESGNKWPTLAFGSYTDLKRKNYSWGTCTPTLLFRPVSDTSGYGQAIKLEPGYCALSMLFSDWSRSGQADLRVANDREYYKNGHGQLWQIQPGQAAHEYLPAEGFKPLQIWGMGIASHDVDGDGYPEIFLSSMSDNKLQKLDSAEGQIKPAYSDIAFKRGVTAHRPYVGGDVRPSTGWDTDQFPNSIPDVALALYLILQSGGLATGGMDVSARALLIAEKMILDGRFALRVKERYQDWDGAFGQDLLKGRLGLDSVAARTLDRNLDTRPLSGRQEQLENLLNGFI